MVWPIRMAVVAAALALAILAPAGAAALTPLPATAATPGVTPAIAPLPWLVPLSLYAPPQPGSGAWYWPTGSEDFGGYSGWLDDRGSTWHVAQDMACPYGHPVYAIAAGVVWKASTTVMGYGPGAGPGGAMIIVHTTASGVRFRALYGHIMGLRYHAGQHVAAGAVIARINAIAPSHLHFSIHPGTHYLADSPWAGSVPKSWPGHGGFVDPVKFLRTHPRVIPYLPPALPLTTIVTDSVASAVGAVAGVAYWTEQTADGPVTSSCDLATGARAVLAAGTSAPAFDTVRYVVALLAAPATGFTVSDRRPVLVVGGSPTTPAWGAPVTLRGRLLNAAGRPFQGARLVLERRSKGVWLGLAAAQTASDGRLALAWTPSRRTALRLRYVPPGRQPAGAAYLAVGGTTVTVTPRVALRGPSLPASVTCGRPVTVVGTLQPGRAAAPRSVRLVFQRRVGGVYGTVISRRAAIRGEGSSARWAAVVKPAMVGLWRVRAVYAGDAAYAATVGSWHAFRVR